MKILDLSAGSRGIWFKKDHPLATYLDKRAECNPSIVCDIRAIPSHVGAEFNLICWDPPHTNCGPNSHMSERYGHSTSAEIRDLLEHGSREAHRVSAPNGLMAFKWSDHSISLDQALALLHGWEPLFGHTVKNGVGTKHRKKGTRTYWVMLRRLT